MMGEEKEKKSGLLIAGVLAVIIIIILVLVFWLLSNQTETRTATTVGGDDYSSMTCMIEKIPDDLDPVLKPKGAEKSEYILKMYFDEGELSKISYEYNGVCSSRDASENEKATLHADYNKYMERVGVYAENFNPVFMNEGNNVKITLYAERKRFSSSVASLFLMSREDYGKMGNFSLENMKKLYEGKGFSCSVHE